MKRNSSTMDLDLSSNERLYIDSKSPFDPKKYHNFKPYGLKIYTFNCGLKKKFDDLLIIVFDKTVNSANIYSKTSTPSAPIIWDKKYNKGKVKVLIVNSGNANAHTGNKGLNIINKYTSYLAKYISCSKSEILVSSTGVIGEYFDPNLIINQISKINKTNSNDLLSAAKSIMTTDTYPKISMKRITIDRKSFKIFGFAKGSGMIHPNMGTMLAYIFIEACIEKNLLNKLLKANTDDTFNSISVDTDTSTSDTLILFSLNKANINLKKNKNFEILNKALYELMKDLSLKIIKDGEGITKLLKVYVTNAQTKKQAKNIGMSIISSPLVKTAISGEDANWGRVIMAIGKTREKIDQNKIKILFGENLVCLNGSMNPNINLNKLDLYMKQKDINITVNLNNGKSKHTVYGNDLSHQYIKINSDYRS